MSEVNQAFLRAYLKNRTAQSQAAVSAPASPPSRPTLEPNAARPSATAPRLPKEPPSHPAQTLPSGARLRFDPSHATPNTSSARQNTDPQSGSTAPAAPSNQTRNVQSTSTPTVYGHGVWSPTGVERGMKAMESSSSPAVVRNGVPAITRETSQYRKPTMTIPQNGTPGQAANRSIQQTPQPHVRSNHSAVGAQTANASYDPVVFVDGLPTHAASQQLHHSRPTERTLAEIGEPIAFGTGSASQTAMPRSVPSQNHPLPVQNNPTPPKSNAQPFVTLPVSPVAKPSVGTERTSAPQAPVTRRFDESRHRPSAESPAAPAAPPVTSRIAKGSTAPTALPLPVAFAASWEVDMFHWPEVVHQIEKSHAEAYRQIGKHLSLANRDGLKVMAVTSGERGVGRSTVAMHMARCAANAGLRVALIDGDTFCPSLIDQLRLDMQQGWQDCLFENVPLHEVAIHSIGDNITFFPLTSVISQQQMHANLHRMAKLIRRVSTVFDMVFIDANRLNLEQRDLIGVSQESVVDAAIVVVDTELSIKEKVDTAVSILQGMGISSVGLVENFQS